MNKAWMLSSNNFDGTLHYRYPVLMIQHSEERLVAYHEPGPYESYRGSFTSNRHWLRFYWRERPYVLTVQWEADWQPRSLYIDITTATSWSDGTVRCVDMDLDLILDHGSEAVFLDDEDEFEEHRVLWSYPEELVKGCHAAVEEVRGLLALQEGPFDQAIFAWRPGEPLPG